MLWAWAVKKGQGCGGRSGGTRWGVSPPLHRVPCPCCGVDGAARGTGRTHGPPLLRGNMASVCPTPHISGAPEGDRDILRRGWSREPCRGATGGQIWSGAGGTQQVAGLWLGGLTAPLVLQKEVPQAHACIHIPQAQPVQPLAARAKITSMIILGGLVGAGLWP